MQMESTKKEKENRLKKIYLFHLSLQNYLTVIVYLVRIFLKLGAVAYLKVYGPCIVHIICETRPFINRNNAFSKSHSPI